MPDLLQELAIPSKVQNEKKIMMDSRVPPDTAPYLITNMTGTLWIEQRPSGVIRAAYRKDGVSKEEFYTEALRVMLKESHTRQWENIFPLTKSGYRKAIERMGEFDYSEDEVQVIGRKKPRFDVDFTDADWSLDDIVIVIPKDREYLGWVHEDEAGLMSVIHNSARAICFLVPDGKLDRYTGASVNSGTRIA